MEHVNVEGMDILFKRTPKKIIKWERSDTAK